MSLAGFPAPKERSKLRHSTHRRNLQESEQDFEYSVLSKSDTLCPNMLYTNVYLNENRMCGKAKIMN